MGRLIPVCALVMGLLGSTGGYMSRFIIVCVLILGLGTRSFSTFSVERARELLNKVRRTNGGKSGAMVAATSEVHIRTSNSAAFTRNAPPTFATNAGPRQWHFIGSIPEARANEITQKQNPPFSRSQYDRVIEANKQIEKYIRDQSKSDEADDCLNELEQLYSGGTISVEQFRAVKVSIMTDEMKRKIVFEVRHPTYIKRKGPGESRQSKMARARRKAEQMCQNEREGNVDDGTPQIKKADYKSGTNWVHGGGIEANPYLFVLIVVSLSLSLFSAYVTLAEMRALEVDWSVTSPLTEMVPACLADVGTCLSSALAAGAFVLPPGVGTKLVFWFMAVALVLERTLPGNIDVGLETATGNESKSTGKKSEKKKKTKKTRGHNHRRKDLIRREKMSNHYKNQCSSQKRGFNCDVVMMRVSRRRYLTEEAYVAPVTGNSYDKKARAAALREILLRKVLKSMRKKKHDIVSGARETELLLGRLHSCVEGEIGSPIANTVSAAHRRQNPASLARKRRRQRQRAKGLSQPPASSGDEDLYSGITVDGNGSAPAALNEPGAFARMRCNCSVDMEPVEPAPEALASTSVYNGPVEEMMLHAPSSPEHAGISPLILAESTSATSFQECSSREHHDEIDIVIKTVPAGHKFRVRARRSEQIVRLKERIAGLYLAPTDGQRLIFDKTRLSDNDTIDDCNIRAGNTIYLSMAFYAEGDDDGRGRRRERKPTVPFEGGETGVRATGYAQGPAPKSKRKRNGKTRGALHDLMYENGSTGAEPPPAVVKQKRFVFQKTPAKPKRKNDFKQAVGFAGGKLAESMLPGKSPATARRMVTEAMVEVEGMAGEEADLQQAKLNMVSEMVDKMENQKPKDRRPMMALVTKHMTKPKAQQMLRSKISKWEWQQARLHALYPGPMEPAVEIVHTKARVKVEALADFLGFLDENYLQKHAFGQHVYETTAGKLVQLDAISTTANDAEIIRGYNRTFRETAPRREDQCDKRDPRTHFYCKSQKDHEGNCDFTSRNMLSPTSVSEILGALTKGPLKSMAGLDDEDVLKGSRSVKRLHEIFDELLAALPMDIDGAKKMRSRIDRVLDYHKTTFITHLRKNAERSCQCISCGLHSDEEHISCPIRAAGEKQLPCDECEQSFAIYSDLLNLAREAQTNAERAAKVQWQAQSGADFVGQAQSEEELAAKAKEPFVELEDEVGKCRQNLEDWRSHIVRKKVESAFSRQQMQSLKKDEAIVVSDFKMKILPMYFRERKREFFGKRGCACLGFMVVTNVEEKESEVDVNFFFFFSDDTKQDTNFVLAGKSYIYNEFLPTQFPDDVTVKVHFESDGAGCFNSNLAKSCMPYWYEWTNGRVDEIQIRHSVNGDGKSSLDGAFGKLGRNLLDAVNNGVTDITNAATCLAAYQNGAGIKGATGAILSPNREKDLAHKKKAASIRRLITSHCLVLDRENKRILSYSNSGYGEGVPIPLTNIDALWKSRPSKPEFSLTQQTETLQSEQRATHSTESMHIRAKRVLTSKIKSNRDNMEKQLNHDVAAAKEKGLYVCDVTRDYDGARCRWRGQDQRFLDLHKERDNHSFPKLNMVDQAVKMASLDDGILHCGRRFNRNEEYCTSAVQDGTGAGSSEGEGWQTVGCYRKRARATAARLNAELKKVLIRMFDEGEASDGPLGGKNKYTPEKAEKEIRGMTLSSGLRKFSSTSEHGPVPSVDQIKSFWSRHKQGRAEKEARKSDDRNDMTGEDIDEWRDLALDPNAPVCGDDERSSLHGGRRLEGKVFVLDGSFEDVVGGIESVKSAIEGAGGKVGQRLSKHTDYLLIGQKPKKNKPENVVPTNWSNVQKLLKGEISLEDLSSDGRKQPADARADVDIDARECEVELSLASSGQDGDAPAIPRGVLEGKAFVLDGSFEDVVGGIESVKSAIEGAGGKVGQRLSKRTDFLLIGQEPKKNVQDALAKYEKMEATSWVNVQKLLNGEILLESLPDVIRSNSGAPPKKRSCHREIVADQTTAAGGGVELPGPTSNGQAVDTGNVAVTAGEDYVELSACG